MQIKPERLKIFKELYKEMHGVELTDAEAYKSASALLGFVSLCIKPLEPVETPEEFYYTKQVVERK
ncbi:MAG: hypothetical protein ABIO57_00995 [Candidatus Paceibacterota bacterium]